MSKKIAILQSNYIPWKGYFDIINSVDTFVIYDEVQYTKNDWRNRNMIKTPKGLEWLTIPVKFSNQTQKINETQIAFSKWNIKHWKSIQSNYSKAPFFNDYKDIFENLYLNCELTHLSEINLLFIKTINEILGIQTKIIDSSSIIKFGNKNERLIQIIKKMDCKEYLSGPSAKNYIDLNLFEKNKININWIDYSKYPKYNQLHGNFEHSVSIIDMLFNLGEKTINYISNQNE